MDLSIIYLLHHVQHGHDIVTVAPSSDQVKSLDALKCLHFPVH